MSEYIEKSSLLQSLKSSGIASDFAMYKISNFPTADVAPVVHGEWLNIDGDYTFAACSICETAYEVATEEEAEKGLWDAFMCSYRYCPNCGAKMDGGDT